MPNIIRDGFLVDANFIGVVSRKPTGLDFALQNAVQAAINTAALAGNYTATINVSSYNNALVQLLIERLINTGYVSAVFGGTNLVVTWN